VGGSGEKHICICSVIKVFWFRGWKLGCSVFTLEYGLGFPF